MAGGFWKKIRLVVLVYALFMVAGHSWLERERATDWDEPLYVGVYPANGDGSAASERYIESLAPEHFQAVARFFDREARRYGVPVRSAISIVMAEPLDVTPPKRPRDSNILQTMLWSLQLRYWSWMHADGIEPAPDIKMFVLYYDPQEHVRLPHSVGLQKGMLGIVHAFSSPRMAGSNRVVLAHELLHTLGASDKYDPASNLPLHPHGYAEPGRVPLHPQTKAEIMAGRVPVSETMAAIPADLEASVIGNLTAAEIRWVDEYVEFPACC